MDYLILLVAACIGAGIGYFFHNNNRFSKRLLMFSAGLLLTIAILEIFPMLYRGENGQNFGVWIIIGVGLQLFLEALSKGIEHGHVHYHKKAHNHTIPLSVMIGLFIHSFLEGMPIEGGNVHEQGHIHLIWALSIHKIPETIVLSTFLFTLHIKKVYSYLVILLFILSAPIGALAGTFLSLDSYLKITGIVAGIFLHISSVIIFESNEKHTLDWQKFMFVFLGICTGYLISQS